MTRTIIRINCRCTCRKFTRKLTYSLLFSFFIAITAIFIPSEFAFAQNVKITGVSDFAFGTWSGSGDMTDTDTLCIYRDSGGDDYSITASGSGAGGSFSVSSGGGNLSYQIRWRKSGGSFISLNANSGTNFDGAHTASETCGGVDNAEIEIQFTSGSLEAAIGGSYSGTLTLLIAPV